jgi:hypothetical protein
VLNVLGQLALDWGIKFLKNEFYTIECISRKIKVIDLKMHGENMEIIF